MTDRWDSDEMAEQERAGFLRVLTLDPYDEATRLVYSDWLEEHGERDEAARQRAWTRAKRWLARFASGQHGRSFDGEKYSSALEARDYASLVAVVTGKPPRAVSVTEYRIGPRSGQSNADWAAGDEFWKNWSVVTGMSPPPPK